MSGRGRGNRPGRGRGRNNNRGGRYQRSSSFKRGKNYFSGNSSNQKEYKFHPHTHGKQQYASYASVKDVIIQNIQKSWKGGYDIGKSLRDLAVYDLDPHKPTRQETSLTDADKAQ